MGKRLSEPPQEANRAAYEVIGAAIEVHRHLGPGHLEAVYESALCVELELRGIPFARQFTYDIEYKGRAVGKGRIDLLVAGCLVIELKAWEAIAPIHTAKTIAYLKATGRRLALIINFNHPLLHDGIERITYSPE